MKTKKVIALMMAATLATTGSGVTTLAEQADDMVEGTAAEEADEELKKAAVPSDELTVTATPEKTECEYGDTVKITTTVELSEDAGAIDETAEKEYQLLEDDKVSDTNNTGIFSIQPKNGSAYQVKVTVSLVGQKQKVYASCGHPELLTQKETHPKNCR